MMVLAYLIMQVLGFPLPSPGFPVLTLALLVIVFLLMGIGEEVGWMGYAIDRLQRRWSALYSALALGVVWGVWHVIPLVQAHRAPGWIAWIYNNTHGSVFSAVLTHAADNLSWMLFPNLGSHYDPRIISPIIAAGALVVIAAWGPRTLTRGRRGSEPPL